MTIFQAWQNIQPPISLYRPEQIYPNRECEEYFERIEKKILIVFLTL